ncbi:MAG: LysR family transcriptional regulator [Actinobacteria bacterium]|nr:LysR family transcriptional regulator [Actinomycetota bacterium]MBV8394981.1 LysR family transcriptional regulator [Actinomycetota bacterium]MBV8599669.1 LysR family transcriptional regulator [Actinomycetota bacterium]
MPVTLNQLSSFLAVAREGSVSAAAEKLYVTQPSISAAVSALSKEVGVELTERVGRGVGLTAAGEAFRPYAADVLGLIEQGRRAAQEASESATRTLSIVAVATAAEFVVPSLLRAFAAAQPEIRLSLEVANRATLFERVLEHDVDVAIAGRPPDDERIDGRAFLPNEIVLITAPDDPLASGKPVRADQLAERVWLQREEGSGTRELVGDFLGDHDLRPQTLTLGSNGAIKEAVRLGLGISLQSRMAVDHELASGALGQIAVRGGLPRREWYALRSATVPPRPAVQLFLEFTHGPGGKRAFKR